MQDNGGTREGERGVGDKVDVCEGMTPFKIFVRFYFRYILYTTMATRFAPFFLMSYFVPTLGIGGNIEW